jgi:hypothetical protein
MQHMIGFCIIGLLAGCLAGCGEDTGRQYVYGNVTLDGDPVIGGHVSYAPQSGTTGYSATATTDDEGNYEIEEEAGPTIGSYRVGVSWKKPTGEKAIDGPSGIEMDITAEAIPARYSENTELVVEITEGSNEHDLALTTKKE